MAITYDVIASNTLSAKASSIVFNSIPATYTDLRIVLINQNDTNAYNPYVLFNNDSGTNYTYSFIYGNSGSTVGSVQNTGVTFGQLNMGGQALSPYWGLDEIDLFSYSSTTIYKTYLFRSSDNNSTSFTGVGSALWKSFSAINSVSVFANAGLFSIGTTVTIFGIKAA